MTGDPDTIIETLDTFKKEQVLIEEQIWELCYHMKGVTLHEAWLLSTEQRARMFKFITKKIGKDDNIIQ